MDSRNFAIGMLSTTAVILLVGILIVHSRPAPALAGGMTASSGQYTLTVGTVSIGDEEVLYLIRGNKLIVYRFDIAKDQIEIVEGMDLTEMAKAASGQQAPPSGTRGGRRP